jgi:anti-sigma factor RsiW
MTELERDLQQLHRYHDGELSGFELRLFERRLRRSPALQGELSELERVSALIARAELDPEPAGAPDLWAAIASALPAIDAQVADERAATPRRPAAREIRGTGETGRAGWLGLPAWAVPTAALAAAAVVALAIVSQLPGAGPGSDPTVAPQIAGAAGVVRYIDSGEASVMVIEDEAADMTIVWMMEAV